MSFYSNKKECEINNKEITFVFHEINNLDLNPWDFKQIDFLEKC